MGIRRYFLMILLLSLLALAGCRPVTLPGGTVPPGTVPPGTVPPPMTPTPVAITLGQPFALAFGGGAVLQDAGLVLAFTAVTEDSRCPADVTCIQAGSVAVDVQVEPTGEPSQTVRLGGQTDTNGTVTGVGLDPTVTPTAAAGGYTLELLTVLPYPPQADPTVPGEYMITLVVR